MASKLKLDMIFNVKTSKALSGLKKIERGIDKISKKIDALNKKKIKIGGTVGASTRGGVTGGDVGLGVGVGAAAGATAGMLGTAALSAKTLHTLLGITAANLTTMTASLGMIATWLQTINMSMATGVTITKAWQASAAGLQKSFGAIGDTSVENLTATNMAIKEVTANTTKDTETTKKNTTAKEKATKAWGKFKFVLLAAGAAIGAFVLSSISVGAKFESLRAKLASVTSGTLEAEKAFMLIKDTASKLPTTVEETTEAFIRMSSLGIVPTQERMLAVGNVASAMGKSILQFTEAVADASVGEFERLKEFGIKAAVEGDKVTMRFKGQSKQIGNNATEIVDYLQKIGEVEFGDAASRQMETLTGRTSNLKDAVAELQDSIAKGGINDAVKNLVISLTNLAKWINTNYNNIRRMGISWVDAVGRMSIATKAMAGYVMAIFTTLGVNAVRKVENMANSIIRAYKTTINQIDKLNPFTDDTPVYEIPPDATVGMLSYADALKEVNDTRVAEFKQHQAALDLWNLDIPLTEAGVEVAKDYNDELKKRDIAQRAAAQATKDAAAAQKILNKLMEEGRQLTIDMRTPEEALAARLIYLQKLLDKGAIGWETYTRAVFEAQEEYDNLVNETEDTADRIVTFWQRAAEGMQDAFADTFFNWMQGKTGDMVGDFKRAIDRMVAEALSAKLLQTLFGDFIDTGTLGGIFGGFRADGGPVSANTPYIVGERGPELMVPSSSGAVVPNDALSGGGATNVYITAMDSQSIQSALQKNGRFIADLVSGTANTYNLRTA